MRPPVPNRDLIPLPGIYDPDFIAANQEARADNLIKGSKHEQMEAVRAQIREFKAANGVDKVSRLCLGDVVIQRHFYDFILTPDSLVDVTDHFTICALSGMSLPSFQIVVLWTANTERYSEVVEGLNDTAETLMASIEANESEVAPSTLYAAACVLEGVPFINGAPQNTFVPGTFTCLSSDARCEL